MIDIITNNENTIDITAIDIDFVVGELEFLFRSDTIQPWFILCLMMPIFMSYALEKVVFAMFECGGGDKNTMYIITIDIA